MMTIYTVEFWSQASGGRWATEGRFRTKSAAVRPANGLLVLGYQVRVVEMATR